MRIPYHTLAHTLSFLVQDLMNHLLTFARAAGGLAIDEDRLVEIHRSATRNIASVLPTLLKIGPGGVLSGRLKEELLLALAAKDNADLFKCMVAVLDEADEMRMQNPPEYIGLLMRLGDEIQRRRAHQARLTQADVRRRMVRDEAAYQLQSDGMEFDLDAQVVEVEKGGAWVQAWVRVDLNGTHLENHA